MAHYYYFKIWLTLAICLTALSALAKAQETPEPPILPFEPQVIPVTMYEPQVIPVTMYEPQEIPVTLYDGTIIDDDDVDNDMFDDDDDDDDDMFDDDDDDMMREDDEDEMEKHLVRDFLETNPEEVNGEPLFQGDMLLTNEQRRALTDRKAVIYQSSRWIEGSDGFPLVPYLFADSRLNTAAIKEGIQHWETHTCIKFTETTNTNQRYLRFIYDNGCYSYIGMQGSNGQPVSIGNGCDSLGVIAHEIGHAMGFFHEQSRPDRDEHVVINLENILDSMEGNFNKYGTNLINNYGIPYDYSSDMHYGPTGFSINGKATIATKDPYMQTVIGQRAGLSHRDKHMANLMYSCIDKWLAACGVSTDPCQNGGYYGANCNCVCPPGTSGTQCETVNGDYFAALRSSCDQEITEEGTVTSPNYPNAYPVGGCVKVIRAPECYFPKLTFSAFTLYGRNPYCSGGNNCCYFDALEIRTSNKYSGDVYCATDISAGQSITSTDREMILYFRSRTSWNSGWSAQLTFEPQSGCTPSETTTTTTTTTTPTTTTTTTPTTTTTTTTPTTTTTTTVSSTESTTQAEEKRCLVEAYSGVFYWTSPDFGVANYPNNFQCGITGGAETGRYGVSMTFQPFELQSGRRRRCIRDVMNVTLPAENSMEFCGNKTGRTYRFPSFNIAMQFTTNEMYTRRGFNISLTPIQTPCHQVITPAVGESGTITLYRRRRACEYKIQAPEGNQVRIDEITPRIYETTGCKRDWLVINAQSQRYYPKETSTVICNTTPVTTPITSTNGEMFIAYMRRTRRSRGFTLKYTIV